MSRRSERALIAVVLAVAGIATDMLMTSQGPANYWTTALVATVAAPLLVFAASFTRVGRQVAFLVAIPFTVAAIVLTPWGYGFWQLPAAGALWFSCSSGTPPTPRTPASAGPRLRRSYRS